MMKHFSMDTTQQGFLTTIQCIGGLGVSLLCIFFGERMNKLKMIGMGIILLSAGSLATAFSASYLQLMLFALVAGVGYTFMDIMENAAVVDFFPTKAKTALPTLHMTFGIGSMVAPYFFVSLLVDPDVSASFSKTFFIAGIAGVAVLALFLFSSRRMFGKQGPVRPAATAAGQNPGGIFKYPAAWIMMAAGVLYFSFQKGIFTWYPTFMNVSAHVDFQNSGLALTLFLIGSLACRIASPVLFNKFSILKMLIIMTLLCGAFMFASILLAPIALILSQIFVVAGGIMQGAFVAAFVFLICEMFPGKSAAATSVVLIAINVGGILTPLWMASLAGPSNEFTMPMYIICAMLFGSAGLIAAAHRINRKTQSAGGLASECSGEAG